MVMNVSSFSSSWSDFDINHHVTSSRYIDWMTDTVKEPSGTPAFRRKIVIRDGNKS
jgi:acyl-ACP thioesterase